MASNIDIEKEPLQPAQQQEEAVVDMPTTTKGALNEDHVELRVGQQSETRQSGCGRVLSRGFKGIAILLIAFLAANGFWAVVRPELYGNNGLLSLNGGEGGHHKHHHHHHKHHHDGPGHGPDHPPPHGPPGHKHPPPPPHHPGGPGGDHPHPPPPPPHKPGHGPGGDHPHPPPPPPHKPGHGPGGDHPRPPPPPKVLECCDLQPGKTLEIRTPLEWAGQSVQVAPSLAGSSVTFVWDGEVGPPAPPRRGPHRGPPPPPPHHPKKDEKKDKDEGEVETKDKEEKDGDEDKPEKKLGDVVYEIEVPSKADWAEISPQELKICTTHRPGSLGLEIFNSSGIPPSHAHITPAFDEIAPLFNTTVYLPSHYARTPISAGHPRP